MQTSTRTHNTDQKEGNVMNSNPNRGGNRKEKQMTAITRTTLVALLVTLGLASAAQAAEPAKGKAPAVSTFKGRLAVVKNGDTATSATLTVKDVTYLVKLDGNGLKLAGAAGDRDVSVQGAVGTTVGTDGKEVKTITVGKYEIGFPATQQAIVDDLGNGVKLEMVLIPAGNFMMGDEPGGVKNPEQPKHMQHKVTLSNPFYMGKYEVTQEQWEAVMGNNPSFFKGAKNPVEQVSWDDCQAFLKQLNKKVSGRRGEFRLPTEAQWEYACRAGSKGQYCFGDDWDRLEHYAWYGRNSQERSHAVGEKLANAWGLYDMHGNVWEWVADYRSDYNAADAVDPMVQKPQGRVEHIFRGGSWHPHDSDVVGYRAFCRSARRYWRGPEFQASHVGFRVMCVPNSDTVPADGNVNKERP